MLTSAVFSVVAAPVHSPASDAGGPLFPVPCQHWLPLTFDDGRSHGGEGTSHCGAICISLTTSDGEQPFVYLLALGMSFLEKWQSSSCAHFLIGFFVVLGCSSSSRIWMGIDLLPDTGSQNCSPVCGLPCQLVGASGVTAEKSLRPMSLSCF